MSVVLVTVALALAVVCVPTVAGMTAMGLAGGDGEPKNWFAGVLAALVGFGAVYNALASFAAYWGLDGWRWWAMFAAPAAGLVGLATASDGESSRPVDWAVGFAMQLAVAVPPMLLLLSDRVTL